MTYINLNIDFDYEDYQPDNYDQGLKTFFSSVIAETDLSDIKEVKFAADEIAAACAGFIEDRKYSERTVMFDPEKFSKDSPFPGMLTSFLCDHKLRVLRPSRLHIAGRDRLVGLLKTTSVH